MSAATPGPWRVFEAGAATDGVFPGIEAGKQTIVVYGADHDDGGVRGATPEQSLANAKLIAAAPQLADMLYEQWELERCEDLSCVDHGPLIRLLQLAGRLIP